MSDSGNVAVDVDDAVLNGKVLYRNQESVLLLKPGLLICKEFAHNTTAFSLPLDKITGCFADKKEVNEFHITALVPRTLVDQSLMQSDFQVKCYDANDVVEWIETLQSVVTDRNIRTMNDQDQRQQAQVQQRDTDIGELASIFPGMDTEVISSVLQANRGDMQRTIDALLGISDPSFQQQQQPPPQLPPRPAGPPTSTPQDQMLMDEQLALALQDELFMQHVNQNEQFRSQMGEAHAQSDFKISEKFQEMSDATKKTFTELYHKFKRATEKRGPIELNEEEMTSVKKGDQKVPAGNDIHLDDEDDEDAPLERNTKLFGGGSKGAYQPLKTDSDNQKLIAGGDSSHDDDGL